MRFAERRRRNRRGAVDILKTQQIRASKNQNKGIFGSVAGLVTGGAKNVVGLATGGVKNVAGYTAGGIKNVAGYTMGGVKNVGWAIGATVSLLGSISETIKQNLA